MMGHFPEDTVSAEIAECDPCDPPASLPDVPNLGTFWCRSKSDYDKIHMRWKWRFLSGRHEFSHRMLFACRADVASYIMSRIQYQIADWVHNEFRGGK